MTTFFLCWYALGWVAAGFDFAVSDSDDYGPLALCFFIPPFFILVTAAVLIYGVLNQMEKYPRSKQYLWRKP